MDAMEVDTHTPKKKKSTTDVLLEYSKSKFVVTYVFCFIINLFASKQTDNNALFVHLCDTIRNLESAHEITLNNIAKISSDKISKLVKFNNLRKRTIQ